MRRAAAADFAVAASARMPIAGTAYEPGEARLVDLIAQNYFAPVSVMTLRGSELAQAARAMAATPELRLEPDRISRASSPSASTGWR